jgi:uncharacterized RDD family membrane protein YckC
MQTIEIRTTQNVTIEYELASLRERIFAFLVDFVIVMVCYYLLVFIIVNLIASVIFESGLNYYFVYGLLPIFLFIVYSLVFEILNNGKTIGKKTLGIKVVRLDGKEPGLSDYLLRSIFLIVDVVLCFGVVAALLVGSTAKRQRLGDMTAGTTVVRIRSNLQFHLEDILKINSLENYEPHYPQIRQMSERDMLLIKNVLSRYQAHRNKAHAALVHDLVDRMTDLLELPERPANSVEFLKTLIRDYIVLTR